MGIRRSLNREMKKFGYFPEVNRLHRSPKHFLHTWTNGETRVGLFCVDGGFIGAKRLGTLPIVNQQACTWAVPVRIGNDWSNYAPPEPGTARTYAKDLVEHAVRTLE